MTTPTTAILGIDLGATEVKAGLVGLDGRLLAMARAGYALQVGHGPGWAEQDPGAWWSAVTVAIGALRPPEPDHPPQPGGGSKDDVRDIPAARPLAAMTSAILRDASSIISSPSITAPRMPPASDVCQS